MRNCKGLIDSLMRYVEKCITAGTPDNQSLENCVCILHNLTYQLETEMPSLFTKINMLASYARSHSSSSDAGPIGCFSSQSQKLQQEQSGFDYPVMEDNNPKGAGWLFHSKALQMYLNLLSSSERDATLEASCGALQNLTATDGLVRHQSVCVSMHLFIGWMQRKSRILLYFIFVLNNNALYYKHCLFYL
ncbi:plakophilin-1-like [Sinocyclocheilus grahami]|uniref:plakophilin-1-like n=1 Tax=Sinocyclocheilus grahami TaxID=75366 RepID=UPI0007ACF799|nr:PREDICTED: plakophilin-1-like [Sinocyclocheilus grahami]